MQKWKSVIFLTFLALLGLIVGLSRLAKNQRTAQTGAASAALTAPLPETADSAPVAPHETASAESSAAPSAPDSQGTARALPANAPNDVVFGAILLTFEGAQGAPSKARTKAAASQAAQRIMATAQTSFEDAVKMGDPGSMANAGSMRRGILEPNVEYALFTLEKGALYPEPIETPRGYWIMRRIK
jgi:hypothetical protein